MANVTTLERPRQRVKLAIPAEYVEDFRSALVAEIKHDGEWFEGHDNEVRVAHEPERLATVRVDRNGALSCLLEDSELLQQLPADDVDAAVSSSGSALVHVLERVARQWTSQLAQELDYGPANFDAAPALLERLRWTVENVAAIEGMER